MIVFWLILGLVILIFGAEFLVKGAARIAEILRISPLIIGLTIVAFGTSSPEMAVSVKAALTDHPDLILGTNLGSTIFNILFILGICALITPLVVSQQLVWYEVPIMIAAHLLLLCFSFNGKISRLEAFFLFLGLVAYIIFAIYKGRKEAKIVKEEYQKVIGDLPLKQDKFFIFKQIFFIFLGLTLCVIGSNVLIDSSVALARLLGVTELVIGVTIVAAGTSLPEVATSVVAAIRGQRDIAIGNVVGSNIFNILGIVGLSGLLAPNGIAVSPIVIYFDLPIAISACFACLPIFFTQHKISRWEGALFLGYYILYILYTIMAARNHYALPIFTKIMAWFVIPITILTLFLLFYRAIAQKKKIKK